VTVVVLGDAALDVTVAPSRPPSRGDDVPAEIHVGVGGQAANVAVRLARRGIGVILACPLADDLAGTLLLGALNEAGVEARRLAAERTTVVVALLDPAGERGMLSDRTSLDPVTASAAIREATWVHCSGYALADDATGDALGDALRQRPDHAPLSVSGGSFEAEPAHVERIRHRLEVAGVDLLILDRREAENLVGAPSASTPELLRALAGLVAVPIVTSGAAGSAAMIAGELLELPAAAMPGPAVDATGAGDAYASATIALLQGAWPPGSASLRAAMTEASVAGARVAAAVGAQAVVAGERA